MFARFEVLHDFPGTRVVRSDLRFGSGRHVVASEMNRSDSVVLDSRHVYRENLLADLDHPGFCFDRHYLRRRLNFDHDRGRFGVRNPGVILLVAFRIGQRIDFRTYRSVGSDSGVGGFRRDCLENRRHESLGYRAVTRFDACRCVDLRYSDVAFGFATVRNAVCLLQMSNQTSSS